MLHFKRESNQSLVHIIGAGLAGLSAAVELTKAGIPVTLSDQAARAGGRCRSYHDPQLGMVIDNGNHLVFSGNRAVNAYLATIGASERLTGPDHAAFAFHDLRDGTRWTMRASDGRIPWWVFQKSRRTPGTRVVDHLPLARLMTAGVTRCRRMGSGASPSGSRAEPSPYFSYRMKRLRSPLAASGATRSLT